MSNVLRCEVAVTRDGDMDVCDKPAVGRLHLLDWEDEEFGAGEPYPACRFHLYRLGGNGRAVELTESDLTQLLTRKDAQPAQNAAHTGRTRSSTDATATTRRTAMRVYIAGPMSGHADLNRPAFESAAAMLRSHGHEPFIPHDIDPADHDGPCPTTYAAAESGHDSACYLRADLIAMLQRADAAYFLPGLIGHATT